MHLWTARRQSGWRWLLLLPVHHIAQERLVGRPALAHRTVRLQCDGQRGRLAGARVRLTGVRTQIGQRHIGQRQRIVLGHLMALAGYPQHIVAAPPRDSRLRYAAGQTANGRRTAERCDGRGVGGAQHVGTQFEGLCACALCEVLGEGCNGDHAMCGCQIV